MVRHRTADRSLVINRVRGRQAILFDRQQGMRTSDRCLDELYEKIYFHEIDGRDKVAQRLQLPLVAFLAVSGFIGNMLQNVQRNHVSSAATIFWICSGLAILGLIGAAWFFVVSVVGKKYKYLETPEVWKGHHEECAALYRDYRDAGKLTEAALKKNIVETYINCGTENGKVNARKAFYVFMLLRCLVVAALFTILAFAVFFIAKLDKNLVKVTHRVEITNQSLLKGASMSNEKPPPPPPAPAPREIREDRPTPTHQPKPPAEKGSNNGR